MARVLMVTDDAALREVVGLQYHYMDNGGEPDGNAWLPSSDELDSLHEITQEVVLAGQGRVVDVKFVKESYFTPNLDDVEVDDNYIEKLHGDIDDI